MHLLGKPRVHSSSRRLQLGTNPVLTRHLRRALCRGALLQPSGESRDTVVVPAAPGDVLAAIRAQKTKLKPRPAQDENASRTPPRKPGPPGRSPRSAFCAVINTRAARDKVPAAGCV